MRPVVLIRVARMQASDRRIAQVANRLALHTDVQIVIGVDEEPERRLEQLRAAGLGSVAVCVETPTIWYPQHLDDVPFETMRMLADRLDGSGAVEVSRP